MVHGVRTPSLVYVICRSPAKSYTGTDFLHYVCEEAEKSSLYFCPILALMADVIGKFQQGDQCYGRIIVINLDELEEIILSAKQYSNCYRN